MKQLRELWKWRTAAAPIVFGSALMIVVMSCGDKGNPAGPSGVSASRGLASTEPTPTPTPSDPPPDPTPTPTPDPTPEPTPTPTPEPTPTPTPTPTPPQGGQGCTPGYWKQEQHFDSWPAPYDPDDLFSSVFEDAFPGLTLLDVLELQGGQGGLNQLGRAAVAALLNGASDGVDYNLTAQQVIDAFNAVFPGGDYETLKNRLDFLNNQGCTLN